MSLMNREGGRTAALFSALALALSAAPASAAEVRVDPVNVLLAPGRNSAELRVANADDKPVSMRATLVRWTQPDGRDRYEPAPEAIASPPIFTIPAGGSQTLRLGLRSRTDGSAYRIRLEEIPSGAGGETGIRVALKLDLPLYVLAAGQAKPQLGWSAARAANGEFLVTGRNGGARHARVLGLELLDADGRTLAAGGPGVVLPGASRDWHLRSSGAGTPAVLIVTTPDGKVRSPLGGARP